MQGRAAAHHHDHEMPTSGAALESRRAQRHAALPHRLRDRRGPRHDHRYRARVLRPRHDRRSPIALAFLFGYALTSLPLLRAGLALSAVIPIALASDTLSIALMEIVDNAIMLGDPGAMEAGLGDVLFWGALAFALVIAGPVALAGQPLAHRSRQGPRRRPRDRHPWRAAATGRRHRRRRGLRLRLKRPARRGS